jgi:hypothetical protein
MDNAKGFIYLATPYSVLHPISKNQANLLKYNRHERACKMAASLMQNGENVFCPIAHTHAIEVYAMKDCPQDMEFWMKQCLSILQYAKELVVFKMDGWDESLGIKREIEFAKDLNIPIRYIENVVFKNLVKVKAVNTRWANKRV